MSNMVDSESNACKPGHVSMIRLPESMIFAPLKQGAYQRSWFDHSPSIKPEVEFLLSDFGAYLANTRVIELRIQKQTDILQIIMIR